MDLLHSSLISSLSSLSRELSNHCSAMNLHSLVSSRHEGTAPVVEVSFNALMPARVSGIFSGLTITLAMALN